MLHLDWFDRKIIEFILAWAPYDGPSDDEAFPEFGMRAVDLKARFVEIIAMQTLLTHVMGSDDRALLQRAQAHAYYLHITHHPPLGIAPLEQEEAVAGCTGATVGTRSLQLVAARDRSQSRSAPFSDAISVDGS
ncbi:MULTISPECIES: hypothetical protein [unclassified Mycolicibacterium]|uniref:hypothetical protein n=1 Tax=unclassified Mycolicibacterium TaxID=2636767 RepID=UPI002ED92902